MQSMLDPNPAQAIGRQINLIVIHCSASPNGATVDAKTIDGWHASRGFHRHLVTDKPLARPELLHIGYHYVVRYDGMVELGRSESEIGAHVEGFNAHSIGVCMTGTDKFTRYQWYQLKGLVHQLAGRYPAARICGHRDLSPDQNRDGIIEPFEWLKTCPGFDVASWRARGMEPLPENVLP